MRLTLVPLVNTNSFSSQVSPFSAQLIASTSSTVYSICSIQHIILHYTHVGIDAGHHVLHSLHCNRKSSCQESCSSCGHSHHCLCHIHQYLSVDKYTLSFVTVCIYVHNSVCLYICTVISHSHAYIRTCT